MIYFPVCAIITMLLITTEPLNMIDKIVRLYLQKYLRKYNLTILSIIFNGSVVMSNIVMIAHTGK